jgi:hypothetical protein
MTMGILLRVGRNSSGGSNLERELYGGRETLSPVSIEEECAVLAKMFANPIKPEPSAAQADDVLASWYGAVSYRYSGTSRRARLGSSNGILPARH